MEQEFPAMRDSGETAARQCETARDSGETVVRDTRETPARHLSLAVDNESEECDDIVNRIIKMKEGNHSIRKIAQSIGVTKHTVEHALGLKKRKDKPKLGGMVEGFRLRLADKVEPPR
jgi:DNA invertase Pin-like site-specific DNA recombinase